VPNELEFTPATPAPASARPDFSEPSKPSPVPPPPASSFTQTPLKMGLSTPAPAAPAGAVETQPAAGNRPSPVEARFQPAVRSPQPAGPVPLLDVPLRMIGVIGRLYVVLESDRGLVLLDQHAAHERILFEQMMSRIESDAAAPSQKLLLPETIELPPRDAQFLREQLPELTRLGVGLSEFGERTFLLDALPPFVQVPDTRRFVFDLVDELRAAGRELNLARLGELTVAKTVCRHAVKANDPLKPAELENLVEDLRRCAMPYTCPHGRPTLIEMNYRELEKKFGRTQ
jgi:DNA mismatch repair protein MutL